MTYIQRFKCEVGVDDIARQAERLTLSTSFSGTGGAELARHGGALCLGHMRARPLGCTTLWACDSDQECRYELRMLPEPPQCVLGDVTACIRNDVRSELTRHAHNMRYEKLQQIGRSPKLLLNKWPRGCCAMHPDQECEVKKADIHAAGTECPTWSKQGRKDGCSGTRVLAWISWVALRRKLQELIIFHENVPEFPLSLLESELGDIYLVLPQFSHVVCPSKFGQPCERPRRLTLLWHKSLVVNHPAKNALLLQTSWKQYTEMAERTCKLTWEVYFVADDDDEEVQSELAWSLQRPGLKHDMEKSPSARPKRAEWELSAFDRSLNDWEVRNIQKYEELNRGQPMICAVGQSADKHATHNKMKTTMPTIIRNPTLYYSSKHRRWLTPSELRTVHNYVDDALNPWGLQTSFSFQREDFGFPPRRRAATLHQVGNGMALCTESLGFNFAWAVMALLCDEHRCEASAGSNTSASVVAQALADAREQAQPKKRKLGKTTPSDVEEAAQKISRLMRSQG